MPKDFKDLTPSQQNALKTIYFELGRKAGDITPSEIKNSKIDQNTLTFLDNYGWIILHRTSYVLDGRPILITLPKDSAQLLQNEFPTLIQRLFKK